MSCQIRFEQTTPLAAEPTQTVRRLGQPKGGRARPFPWQGTQKLAHAAFAARFAPGDLRRTRDRGASGERSTPASIRQRNVDSSGVQARELGRPVESHGDARRGSRSVATGRAHQRSRWSGRSDRRWAELLVRTGRRLGARPRARPSRGVFFARPPGRPSSRRVPGHHRCLLDVARHRQLARRTRRFPPGFCTCPNSEPRSGRYLSTSSRAAHCSPNATFTPSNCSSRRASLRNSNVDGTPSCRRTSPDSVYTQYSQPGAESSATTRSRTSCSASKTSFDARPGSRRTFISYVSTIDTLSHERGKWHADVHTVLASLDRNLARLHERTRGRLRMVLTADHGFRDTIPPTAFVSTTSPNLSSCLRHPPSGDSRIGVFHVRDGAAEEFARRFGARFSDGFEILTVEQAEQLHLFGPGPLAPARANGSAMYLRSRSAIGSSTTSATTRCAGPSGLSPRKCACRSLSPE